MGPRGKWYLCAEDRQTGPALWKLLLGVRVSLWGPSESGTSVPQIGKLERRCENYSAVWGTPFSSVRRWAPEIRFGSFCTELQFSGQFWIVVVSFCGTQVTIPGRWVLKMDRQLFKWYHFKQFLVQFLVVVVSFCGTKMTTLNSFRVSFDSWLCHFVVQKWSFWTVFGQNHYIYYILWKKSQLNLRGSR